MILSRSCILAVILASKGLGAYLRQHFLDKTFQGLYQVNAFDLALLIPYFIVLIILAAYGAHRYWLVYLYYKHKENKTTEPAAHFDELPRVTVQLPIFNEQYVVDRLLDAVCRLEYPKEKLDIQLLDDSTDETVEVARILVERYAALGHPVAHLHRDNREGFKAGALEAGLKTAKGEFIAIFDADFVPPSDFLMKCIHHFTDPKVGMVQTRWTHINRNYSLLTQVEAILLDGHFVLEHSGRARSGVFFNFNGTAGMWRRCAIDEAGGWEHDTLTEDTDLSYRAQLKGWKFVYLQDVECPAELPVEMTAFKTQQARWAKGLIQVSKKILPKVFASNASRHVKIEAVYHLTANLSYPLMIVLSVLLLPAMIIRFYQGWFQMLYIDLPLFMASTFSISSFYLVSQKELFPKSWLRSLLYLPLLMSLGIGLTVTNTRAVLEALVGKQTAFVRTPKYRVESKKDKVGANKYRKRLGWIPWIELLIGTYFALAVYYAIDNENYFTVPFLLLFVIGYWVTGLMSLLQGRWAGLSVGSETHSKPFPVGV
ncbi:MAG TPA: cellulose synthase family protein [Terriglobales bacterium]|jgi:cellulose synthase/poly-beta-1,6-N-acetylglucosamine synthase-like glycosyltransferase|nr:cellulose synthase family protein [Terriglobales bacterium]